MTPEEHIAYAEKLLALMVDPEDMATSSQQELRVSVAAVHVRIAEYKKKYPPEAVRPVRHVDPLTRQPIKHKHYLGEDCWEGCPRYDGQLPENKGTETKPYPRKRSGRMHNHVKTDFCYPRGANACPAFGTDSTNYPRPIADNPQA